MNKQNLLLEIGCEDLPSWAGISFAGQFKNAFCRSLAVKKLACREPEIFYTPRRLVVLAKDIPEKTEPETKEISGPRLSDLKDEEGNFLQPVLSFARAHGVAPEKLSVRDTNGKKTVFLLKKIEQVPAAAILENTVNEILSGIKIPKAMKWDESGFRFYRPVRWVLCLLGNKTLSLKIGNIKSSNCSYGHRLLGKGKIRVKDWKDYFDRVQKGFVILDTEVRKRFIAEQAVKKLNEDESVDTSLYGELANLVEYPALLRCKLPGDVFGLPEEVLKILIQKAEGLPVFKNGKLCSEFLVVTDGIENSVCTGNYERLIKTRIMDAAFFYKNDLSKSLEDLTEKTKKILFHPAWGSLYQRTERLCRISKQFAVSMGLDETAAGNLFRAAYLCKADTASEMVREFPELQSVMGKIYAEKRGENGTVCTAIADHLKPAFSGDSLPVSKEGTHLAVIDKTEYIAAFITAGAEIWGLKTLTD